MKSSANDLEPNLRRESLKKALLFVCSLITLPFVNSCESDPKKNDPTPVVPTTEPEFEFKDLPTDFRFLPGFRLEINWESKNVQDIIIEYKLRTESNWTLLYSGKAQVSTYPWIVNTSEGVYEIRCLDSRNNSELDTATLEMIALQGYGLDLNTQPTLREIGGTAIVLTNLLGGLAIRRIGTNEFIVLSSECTHAGCTIDPSLIDDGWVCECHGSTFTSNGQVVLGPANIPLQVFNSEFFPDQSILLINA